MARKAKRSRTWNLAHRDGRIPTYDGMRSNHALRTNRQQGLVMRELSSMEVLAVSGAGEFGATVGGIVGGVVGQVGGRYIGTTLGAVVGSAFGPGGTIVGAGIGGHIGDKYGSAIMGPVGGLVGSAIENRTAGS